MTVAGAPTGALVVFSLIGIALLFFVSELIPNDVTAIGIIVSLAVLEPWTGVGPRESISGFANAATVTIVAMYMLSAGVQNTGVVQRLGLYLPGSRGAARRGRWRRRSGRPVRSRGSSTTRRSSPCSSR